jgi:uncharacterized protein YktB (UPF0637 family)
MPLKYEKWTPRFTGSIGERDDNHMDNFWAFFQLHFISDDVEDLAMKLFSATLHGNARGWYDDLPNDSITTMDQLEEAFLRIWSIKLEDIQKLLKRLNYIKQTEIEIVREFHNRFECLLYHIPGIHRPKEKYLIYLYTNALLVHLGFLLNKKGSKTLHEAHNKAMQIEENITLSKRKHIFPLRTKVNDPNGTPDTFNIERLLSLDIFGRREQVINQQEVEGSLPSEVLRSHEEGKEFTHASVEDNEDMVKEREPKDMKQDDELSICAPPLDEAIHELVPPT